MFCPDCIKFAGSELHSYVAPESCGTDRVVEALKFTCGGLGPVIVTSGMALTVTVTDLLRVLCPSEIVHVKVVFPIAGCAVVVAEFG